MKKTKKNSSGTSFFGTEISMTPNQLKKVCDKLGADFEDCNTGGDKTNFDAEFETDSGDVFTVYDWKEYRTVGMDEVIHFHIGGRNKFVTNQARMELMGNLLSK